MRHGLFWPAVLASAAATALPAAAAPSLSEVVTMETQYAYQPPGDGTGCVCAGTLEDLSFVDGVTRLGVQLNSTLGVDGSFFFLHNLYAQGDAHANMTTSLQIAITNTGTEAANMRLDSLITPGFIAFQGTSVLADVSFDFQIRQRPDHPFLGTPTTLYSASGYLDNTGLQANSIQTSDNQMFNGFSSYAAPGRVAFEWGATPLSVALLPIAAGATHFVQYTSYTSVQIGGGSCTTLLGCDGVQVAFGDPRNDGSVGSLRASFTDPGNNQPLIGRSFAATTYSTIDVTEPSAPLPDPDLLPPPALAPNYDWLPPVDGLSGAVPEPSTWLMLITGFGLAGLAMRRQRRQLARSA